MIRRAGSSNWWPPVPNLTVVGLALFDCASILGVSHARLHSVCSKTSVLRKEACTMTPWQQRLTAITERMAGDMKVRNLAQSTIDAYTYHVGRFAEFIAKPVGDATTEDVRSFQLHMIEVRKVSWTRQQSWFIVSQSIQNTRT